MVEDLNTEASLERTLGGSMTPKSIGTKPSRRRARSVADVAKPGFTVRRS